MRHPVRNAVWIGTAGLVGLALLGLYGSWVWSWFNPSTPGPAPEPFARARPDDGSLPAARKAFRSRHLDPLAHADLGEALWRSGREVDSFYILASARAFFGPERFLAAHRARALGADPLSRGPELSRARQTRAQPAGAARAVPLYFQLAASARESYEGRAAIDDLGDIAQSSPSGEDDASPRLAREALEALRRRNPDHAAIFTVLSLSDLSRGDIATVRERTAEALRGAPRHPGALSISGALALADRRPALALESFKAAWRESREELYLSQKLAELLDRHAGDPEAALSPYIALHRRDPLWRDGKALSERILRILASRSRERLGPAPAGELGLFLSSSDASLRAAACSRAGRLLDPKWIKTLGELLDDDVELVRDEAADALARLALPHREAVLANRVDWASSTSPLRRARAIGVLAAIDKTNAFPFAAQALKDPNPAVRHWVRTRVLETVYRDYPPASLAVREYLAAEQDPLVLELRGRPGPGPKS